MDIRSLITLGIIYPVTRYWNYWVERCQLHNNEHQNIPKKAHTWNSNEGIDIVGQSCNIQGYVGCNADISLFHSIEVIIEIMYDYNIPQ